MVGGKPLFFPKKEHAAAENDLLTLCAQYAPPAPMKGPVSLNVVFRFPWRKSESKARMARMWQWNYTRPDLDNMVKLVCDVLTKLAFYGDDGQISSMTLQKVWSEKPGISIEIGEIDAALIAEYRRRNNP